MSEPSKPKRAARPAQPKPNPAARHPSYAPPAGTESAAGVDGKRKSRSGSQRRKKLHMVTTAYDDAELAALDEAASKAGLTRASYQRVQTLATPPKTRSVRRAPVEKELLARLLGQLGRVGNNLNQLARAANIDRTERAEIMITVAEMRGLLPAFMEALGRKS